VSTVLAFLAGAALLGFSMADIDLRARYAMFAVGSITLFAASVTLLVPG
jgi:hypothetical protein